MNARTMIDVIRERAARTPGQRAFTFLDDGETATQTITYAGLDARARAIAATLQERRAVGERALVMFPPGLEFIAAFLGCLYGGVIAVPVYPPSPSQQVRRRSRLDAVARDAEPAIVLTLAELQPGVERLLAASWGTSAPRVLGTDTIPVEAAERWQAPRLDEASLAFLQYTSGSTATPKGVMVTHGNLLHNERVIQEKCGQTAASRIVGWLPLFHDMGLIGNVLHPLFVGAQAVLMPPAAFLEKPRRWLDAIQTFRGTTSGGPNFAYDLCARKIRPDEREGLDLSTWSVAFNGAEPVRPATLDRFAKAFAPCGFRREAFHPCYGLAEGTLMVTGGRQPGAPTVCHVDPAGLARKRVVAAPASNTASHAVAGCGTPASGQTLLIVDPETQVPCGPDEIGEIWTKGPSVASGYWNRIEETARTFDAALAPEGARGYLRTGDLGFVRDGALFVTGRLKDVIIIRGGNHHAEDLEYAAAGAHPAIRLGGVAAFAIDEGQDERLVIAVELDRRAAVAPIEVAHAIRERIASTHALEVAHVIIVRAGALPKTSSGKLQRGACRAEWLSGDLDVVSVHALRDPTADGPSRESAASAAASATDIERRLHELCALTLGIPVEAMPSDVPLIRLGLDSLSAFELSQTLKSTFGVEAPPSKLLGGTRMSDLLPAACAAAGDVTARPAASAPVMDDEASWGQRAVWFQQQLARTNAAYNLARALRLRPRVDAAALGRTLAAVASRHAAFRTGFLLRDARLFQHMDAAATIPVEEIDLTGRPDDEIRVALSERAHHPFDLGRPPLVRVALLRRSPGEDVLLLVAHHLIADLWSFPTFMTDLTTLYAREIGLDAVVPDPPGVTYHDYVCDQRAYLAGEDGRRAARYWEDALAGSSYRAALPLDRPDPVTRTYEGRRVRFVISAAQADRLRAIARSHGATLFSMLLAAFGVCLRRYAGDDDIIVGTPASARPAPAFGQVIGYFVNPVVVRAQVARAMRFSALLQQVHGRVLGALDHQLYPHALLAQAHQEERTGPYAPLFNVMFALQGSGTAGARIPAGIVLDADGPFVPLGLFEAAPMAIGMRTAQFDLSMFVADGPAALEGAVEYSTELFEAATVERLAQRFRAIVAAIVDDPHQTIAEIDLPAATRRRVLGTWNDTHATFDGPIGIHELIEAQVRRTPSRSAVRFDDDVLTYEALNRRANRLARVLRRQGAGPESRVGVCLDRSIGMVVGLLAVLKAGGAYVPLDPAWPTERLAFVMADAGIRVVLAAPLVEDRLPRHAARMIWIDPPSGRSPGDEVEEADDPGLPVCDASLAYVIYTSGSTGRPKGAMNSHGAVRNRLLWMQATYGLTADDRVLQKTPFSFDVSVWEFFWPLLAGATLVVARPDGHRDPAYLQRTIDDAGITTIHFVPSMLDAFLAGVTPGACTTLRRLFSSGEALSAQTAARCHAALRCELHNLYGPTEAAVDVTAWPCHRDSHDDPIPIGRPIGNAALYVLDDGDEPVAPGTTGALHIAGVPVARGYVGSPGLTADRFRPDPYAQAGARMYRTGDLARWREDGALVYLGRRDHQVKIAGHRIELGEIEAALRRTGRVGDAIVTLDASGQRLVAYVVAPAAPAPGTGPEAERTTGSAPATDGIAVDALRACLAATLPDAMIPAAFVVLERFPLSANGKVDRGALPAPARETPARDGASGEPRTPTEEVLVRIWSEVLHIPGVQVDDNFFALGGNSLFAAQIVARTSAELQVQLPLALLFQGAPTIGGLAGRIDAYLHASQIAAGGDAGTRVGDETAAGQVTI